MNARWKSVSSTSALSAMSALLFLFLACFFVPGASAECGLPGKTIHPSAWHPQLNHGSPQLVLAGLPDFDDHDRDAPIVGMWHVLFTAQTQNGVAIPVPGGIVIDNSVVVWHPDGTEVMNSSRSAQDGNFCLGVWKHTGPRTYLLNHIPWQGNVFDPTAPPNAIGAPEAGVQIVEKIKLGLEANTYSGTFTLTAYDTSGNVYQSFTGTIAAKRITPETPFRELLQ